MRAAAGGLIVALLAAAGWSLARKIRAEALLVCPAPAVPLYGDVRFAGLQAGQARLAAVGDQQSLTRPGLYGVAWEGGAGYLGDPLAAAGGVVTRPLTVTQGLAPRVGQAAALRRSFFLGDPAAALGTAVRDVTVPGPLGPLPAWYFPGRGETFVIAVHGQNGTRGDVLRLVDIVHRMGFPALAVTYRGDRGTAPDPSGYYRYGQSEWRDVEAAVRWSLAHGARDVVLAGQSMGGALAAAFLRFSPLAPAVTRVLLDAPALDLHAAVDYQVRRHSPAGAARVLAPLTWWAERVAGLCFGVDWAAVAYLGDTAWLRVPALVTHGGDDTRVPLSVSVTLKRRQPSLVTLAVFPGAGHLESWNTDRARFTSLTRSFLAPLAPPAPAPVAAGS